MVVAQHGANDFKWIVDVPREFAIPEADEFVKGPEWVIVWVSELNCILDGFNDVGCVLDDGGGGFRGWLQHTSLYKDVLLKKMKVSCFKPKKSFLMHKGVF